MDKTLLLTLVVQVLLPLVVGLVTKRSMPADAKLVVLAILTVVNTGVIGYLNGSTLGDVLITGAIGLLTSLGTHYGFYRPVGLSEKVADVLVRDKPAEEPELDENPSIDATGPAHPIDDIVDDLTDEELAELAQLDEELPAEDPIEEVPDAVPKTEE